MTKQELINELNMFQRNLEHLCAFHCAGIDTDNEICDDAGRFIDSIARYSAEGLETFVMDRVEPDYDSTLRNPPT